jgi:hypothetical protein
VLRAHITNAGKKALLEKEKYCATEVNVARTEKCCAHQKVLHGNKSAIRPSYVPGAVMTIMVSAMSAVLRQVETGGNPECVEERSDSCPRRVPNVVVGADKRCVDRRGGRG